MPKLQYIYINSSIEYSKEALSHGDSVKTYADDSLYWPIDINRKVEANIFLRKGDLTFNESWHKFGTKNQIFHKVEDTRELYSPWQFPTVGTPKPDLELHKVFVRLDDKIDYIEVRLYGLLNFFTQLGGIGSFLYTTGDLIARVLVYDLFVAYLMRNLFTVKLLG